MTNPTGTAGLVLFTIVDSFSAVLQVHQVTLHDLNFEWVDNWLHCCVSIVETPIEMHLFEGTLKHSILDRFFTLK